MTEDVTDSEELARFRAEWKAEVRRSRHPVQNEQGSNSLAKPSDAQTSKTHATPPGMSRSAGAARPPAREASIDPASLPPTVARALDVYGRAVACEQRSEIDEALRLYRIAFRIDDKVAKIYEMVETARLRVHDRTSKHGAGAAPASVSSHTKRSSVDGVDQITRTLEGVSVSSGAKLPGRGLTGGLSGLIASWPSDLLFDPEDEKEPVHLQKVPPELLVKILGYLNTATLERFAAVSRKARVFTLDTSIWRRHVAAIYRFPEIGDDDDISLLLDKYMGNPRRMFIEHPRVRLDGVYIAVCHYTRPGQGESAWVNVNHLVTYHRYLRFYPTGQVLTLLTNEGENLQQSISKLQLTARDKSLYIGSWRLEGTTVIVTDLLEVLGESPKYTFQMALDLRSRPLGRWNRLSLLTYETVSIADGEASPLPLKNERPFWFSKVRSYAF